MRSVYGSIFFLHCLLCFLSTSSAKVFVSINGETATLGNDFFNVSLKSDGTFHSLYKGGVDLVKDVSKRSGYLDWNGGAARFSPKNLTLIEQSDDIVHLKYFEEGSSSVLRIELHIVVLSNVSGLYYYVKASNPNATTISWEEFRTVHRFRSDKLVYASNGIRYDIPPLDSILNSRPTIQDATYQLADGTYYSKYDFANYIWETPWYGAYGGNFGAWIISASREYHSGGPLKQDLLVHQDALLCNYLTSRHFGTPIHDSVTGWSKFYGPWLLYFNEGSNEEVLEDVKRQAKAEQANWPYGWVDDVDYPLARGSLDGQVTGQTNATVVLYSSTEEEFDLQTKGYTFTTQTDEEGFFKITNIRPGQYRLVAYPIAGHGSENLVEKEVEIKEGTQNAGILELPEPTEILWFIGETNRRADNFRYSGEQRNFYWQLITPSNLSFVIGKHNPSKDWYYAQSHNGTWNIVFHDQPDGSSRTLRVAIAAASKSSSFTTAALQVSLNGNILDNYVYTNDQSVYRESLQSGNFHSEKISVEADQIVDGENVLSLTVLHGKFMYDAISWARGE